MKVLIGCDPEIFVVNPNSGKFVSAHGLIQGTKDKPFQVKNGAVQVDGMALEINITPADSARGFVHNITTVMDQLKAMVPGHELKITPTATFDQDYWDTLPDAAKELGCDPDFNAYTREPNPRPTTNRPFRTGAGHIHLGWDKGVDPNDPAHFADCCEIVKQLDYYVGMYSLHWDPDNERRSLYGAAGCFRPKSYGCEYRTPSNMWLRDPKLMMWVYNAAIRAVSDLENGSVLDRVYPNLARDVINKNELKWFDRIGHLAGGMTLPPRLAA